jgi:arsenate reductase-like glutaredoxin family protein
MSPEEIDRVASLFTTDEALVANLVHEKKRDAVAGLSRREILARMAEDYTYINRPVAVRGDAIACGPLRFHRARYDDEFG